MNAVILRYESRGTHDNILLSQIWDSPKPGKPRSRNPRKNVAQLYPQAVGVPFRRLLRLAGLR
jgi:hypothetical protein